MNLLAEAEMKKYILIVVAMMSALMLLCVQQTSKVNALVPLDPTWYWQWQGGGEIKDIHFVDEQWGWVLGECIAMRTEDGGRTWIAMDILRGCSPYFKPNVVHFIDHSVGWIGGARSWYDWYSFGAVIQRTTDGGETWEWQRGFDQEVTDIQFVDADHGWANIGDRLYRTTDGGVTWSDINGSGSCNLFQFYFIDNAEGWVATCDGIDHTTDGGQTWVRQFDVPGLPLYFRDIYFLNDQYGWAVGAAPHLDPVTFVFSHRTVFVRTSDGGQTWTQQLFPEYSGFGDVYFGNTQQGWMISGHQLLGSTDGGQTWTVQTDPDNLNALHGVGANHVWVLGDGTITHTANAGLSWVVQGHSIEEIHAVDAIGNDTAWVVGADGAILYTDDGGASWVPQDSGAQANLYGVHFPSAQVGVTVGSEGAIIRTTNAGDDWVVQESGVSGPLLDAYFITEDIGWAVGADGVIAHTSDGGDSWQYQESSVPEHLNAVHFVSENSGWAVGKDVNGPGNLINPPASILLHTVDGGTTWHPANGSGMTDIDFVGSQFGWSVAGWRQWDEGEGHSEGYLSRTIDGGATWTRVPKPCRALYAVDFVSATDGYVAGAGIMRSADGGESWWIELDGYWLGDIVFNHPEVGWAIGRDGLILRRNWYPAGSQGVRAEIVSADDDTCVRHGSGDNLVTWPKVRIGQSDYEYTSGFRFQDIDIPQGATILEATLSLYYADWSRDLPLTVTVYAEDTGDALSFSGGNPPASERPRTSAMAARVIDETPSGWFDLTNLASSVQEVVNRTDWQTGNALSILLNSAASDMESHYLDVISYDNNPGRAAELKINFLPPQTPTPTSTLTSTPTPTSTPTMTLTSTSTPTLTVTPTPTPTPESHLHHLPLMMR